jgi:hypothetical protein
VKDWSGQRKEANQRRGLTDCREPSERIVRTRKEHQPARGTHPLSSAARRTGEDSERKLASEGHSRTVERRARDWSGAKEGQPTRGTHGLSSGERVTSQDSERKPASEGHPRTVERKARLVRTAKEGQPARGIRPIDRRAKNESGQRMKLSEQGALTGCRA